MTQHRAVLFLSAMAFLFITPTASAQSLAEQDNREEIAIYAKEKGIPFQIAQRRLALEEQGSDIATALEAEFSDRLAGLFWSKSPHEGLIVRLTGTSPVADRLIHLPAGQLSIHFVVGAALTVAESRERLEAALPKLAEAIPELMGAWVSEQDGAVHFQVKGEEAERDAYEKASPGIQELLGMPVKFEISRCFFGFNERSPPLPGCPAGG
jgi:hypothetical protein